MSWFPTQLFLNIIFSKNAAAFRDWKATSRTITYKHENIVLKLYHATKVEPHSRIVE